MSRRKSKSDAQVIADCNALARQFYGLAGYAVPEGYRFDRATHPQERLQWAQAALAYEVIEGTDVENALAEEGERAEAGSEASK